jgi:hypothetical protein
MTKRVPILDCDWVEHLCEGGSLLLKGTINLNIQAVCNELSNGRFPRTIRGNFALIWQFGKNEFFAVDHVSSIPLFFSKDSVSSEFEKVKESCQQWTLDQKTIEEISFLGGFNFGEKTSVKEILRVPQGHYFDGKNFVKYTEVVNPRQNDVKLNEVRESFFEEITRISKGNPTLLLSAGTDSWTIFEVIKFLGLHKKFNFLHLYSDNQYFSERKFLSEYFENKSEYSYREHNIKYSGFKDNSADYKKFFSLWKENPFAAKLRAARELKLQESTLVTGEIGVAQFHGTQLLTAAMQMNSSEITENLPRLVVNSLITYSRIFGFSTKLDSFVCPQKCESYYKSAILYFKNKIETLPNDNLLEGIPFLWTEEISAFRLFHYSQDSEFKWEHPFSKASFYEAATSLRGDVLRDVKEEKSFYKVIFGNTLTSKFNLPKLGLSIPAYEKIRKSDIYGK